MKILKLSTLCVLLLAYYTQTKAQAQKISINEPNYNQPKLFADLPQRIILNLPELESLFSLPIGNSINIPLADNFHFQGTVVSKSDLKDSLVHSIIIRSSDKWGTVFTFTRTIGIKGKANYIGRIVSRNSSDAYVITFDNGQYILQKKNYNDIISE
jgi:hypothetical protein